MFEHDDAPAALYLPPPHAVQDDVDPSANVADVLYVPAVQLVGTADRTIKRGIAVD